MAVQEMMDRSGSTGPAAAQASTQEVRHEVLQSPIRGEIVRIGVAPGALVAADQTLLIVEGVKLEVVVRAPFAGRVVECLQEVGAAVDAGTRLAIIESTAGE